MSDTYLKVNIDYIRENIINLRKKAPNSKFSAVVKANAYGLGDVEISRNIEDLVDYFSVARVSEAKSLRNNGITKPILILGYVPIEEINDCQKQNIDITIYDYDSAVEINDVLNEKINAHLAFDTGHSRIGFREFEIDKIKKLKELENLNIVGAFSHFSTADEKDSSYTEKQLHIFDYMIDKIKDDFKLDIIHISNDAGFIKHNIYKDMVRSGISMYGIYPSDLLKEEKNVSLKQSFKLISTVSFVKEIDKGVSISYGRKFISDRKMKIATISIGYADGFMRSFTNCGEVLINGKLARVTGAVCMDQIMVDATGIDVKIGDNVEIYPDIYKEANKIGTITYELMSIINMRIPRLYYKNGELIKKLDYKLGD